MKGRRVVVTGIGALTPIGNNLNNYWDSLIDMYEKAKNKNFGNKNLQNICEHVDNFQDFTKLFS